MPPVKLDSAPPLDAPASRERSPSAALAPSFSSAPSSASVPGDLASPERSSFAWFDQAACGVFFHWGPYSVAARGEWVMNRERIPAAEYQRLYIEPWRAEAFDADAWMAAARALGADYVVFTARHHDGFALWESTVNPHNSTRLGPRRDFVAEIAAAAGRAGLRLGLYYSGANWTHPDYPSAFARDWPLDNAWASPAHRERYQAYALAELRELLSRYGRIDYLWYDGVLPANLVCPAWNTLARELQPGILINHRNGPADVEICEQALHAHPPKGRWEACFTLNRNWGYHAGDRAYKAPLELLELLLKVNGDRGKLLLNVGPRGDGSIPPETSRLVQTCGEWVRAHRPVLSGASASTFAWNNSALVTTRDETVFLHFLPEYPASFCWAETETPLLHARDHLSSRPIRFTREGSRIHLHDVAAQLTPGLLGVAELTFAAPPRPIVPRTTFWIPG